MSGQVAQSNGEKHAHPHTVPQAGMQTQRLPPPSQQKNPLALALATGLRYNKDLKQRQGINTQTSEKQDFFRFKRFLRALESDDYKKLRAKKLPQLPEIKDPQTSQQLFILLIQNQLIQPVDKLTTKDAKARKIKVEKTVPAIQPTTKAVLQPDAYYMWTYTPPNPFMWVYSILGLIVVFTLILFPLWPLWMRKGVWYLSTGMLGLIGVFFGMAIVRLIIYVLSFIFLPKQFWLFPNLFEDVGFFDSFVPLYGWEDPNTKKAGKSKKGKRSVEAPISEKSSTATTATATSKTTSSSNGVSAKTTESSKGASSGGVKKRVATVEDAEE